jgi:hypothetical protein
VADEQAEDHDRYMLELAGEEAAAAQHGAEMRSIYLSGVKAGLEAAAQECDDDNGAIGAAFATTIRAIKPESVGGET